MKTISPILDDVLALLRAEPQRIIQLVPRYTLPMRIVNRITIDDSTGCWRISGYNSGNGFANISIKNKTYKVHRVIFTLIKGPIPIGLVLDHRRTAGCVYRDCGNPDHLEPVTVKINTERGNATLFQPGSCL